MSMTKYVVGFKPPDDTWRTMLAAWDACGKAGIRPPHEVTTFFGGEYPGDKPGMTIEIPMAVKPYEANGESGFDVDIAKLPAGVTIVRFYNAW